MTKFHWISTSFFLAVLVVVMLHVTDKLAVWYGVFISAVNFGLLAFFQRYHRQGVPAYLQQGLILLIRSVVIRFLVVACLLMFSFKYLAVVPAATLLGFVLGMMFFFVNQLIRLVT